MAYLEDVPKYAFGTAFELADSHQELAEGRITESQFKDLLEKAIKLGCRHFDCSPLYKTQHIIGSVLQEATKTIPRSQFFITSKLPINMMRGENVDRSIKMILDELQTPYLDLFLIHAPFSTKYVADDILYPTDEHGNLLLDDEQQEDNLLESCWLKLADLKRKHLVKFVGICNVNLEQLIRLNKINQVDVVQNEYHIYNQDREIFDYCEEIDVHFEAYAAFGSPIQAKKQNKPTIFNDPVVNRVARENNLTVAQVMIQWIHQQPLSYVIRTDNVNQLEENLKSISTVKVSMNDMIELDRLNRNVRIYYYDEHKTITKHREYPFKR